MVASKWGHTEVVQLLLGKGAALDEKNKDGSTTLVQALATLDGDQLGRMAAAQVHGQLLSYQARSPARARLLTCYTHYTY